MKKAIKLIGYTFIVLISALVVALGTWNACDQLSIVPSSHDKSYFNGKILAASDADMISTAYVDGYLGKVEGLEDKLSMVEVNNGTPQLKSSITVSNSVISWPSIIEWNPIDHIAYVVETRGQHLEDNQQMGNVFADFPIGRDLNVIDYTYPESPEIVQKIAIGENLGTVSINYDGSLLAIPSSKNGGEIVIAQLNNGLVTNHVSFPDKPVDGDISTIEFHPTKNIIAANYNNTHIKFYEIIIEEAVNLKPIGTRIDVAKKWSVGNWHPNGKFFILSDVAWGEGPTGLIFSGKGNLVSVKYDQNGKHEIISKAKVDISPEGFDISPNGNYAITVNMRRTVLPSSMWFIPGKQSSSLTLTKINSVTGELKTLDIYYGFEGALPEDVIFDTDSNSIAVAIYQERDNKKPRKGWIEFWELEEDKLVKTNQKIDLMRGVHNLHLVDSQFLRAD